MFTFSRGFHEVVPYGKNPWLLLGIPFGDHFTINAKSYHFSFHLPEKVIFYPFRIARSRKNSFQSSILFKQAA
jgi:hypothetical protein